MRCPARPMLPLALTLLALASAAAPTAADPRYAWSSQAAAGETLARRIVPPPGFTRVEAPAGSFAAWLRGLPLKPAGTRVKLFNGGDKWRQDVHVAVVDIDVGDRDLQQCADAIMRLRAEWLFASGRAAEIAFDYTGGGRVSFARWAKGERPSQDGRRWMSRAPADTSYASLRRYLTAVFAYAGTASLERELLPVSPDGMRIGDVFIKGGFPGHAVLVADMVESRATGERRFLLLQSYMPAQDIHVLKNPRDGSGSPWYPARIEGDLATPEWTFPPGSLRRWR